MTIADVCWFRDILSDRRSITYLFIILLYYDWVCFSVIFSCIGGFYFFVKKQLITEEYCSYNFLLFLWFKSKI